MIVTGAAALILLINEETHIQYYLKLKYFVPSCDILLVFDSQIGKLLIRCLHNCPSLPRKPRNNKIFSLHPILPGKGVMPFVRSLPRRQEKPQNILRDAPFFAQFGKWCNAMFTLAIISNEKHQKNKKKTCIPISTKRWKWGC